MVCSELFKRRGRTISTALRLGKKVSFDNYLRLHREGKRLIRGWFNRACRNRDCSPENSFEPFIFAWIAFNSWGMCVTGYERDSDIIDALAVNQKLNEDFQELMGDSKEFREYHRERGEEVSLNWAHSLKAIYRVRCNLFHGEKAAHSEMDQKIVSSAFQILLYMLEKQIP